MSQEEWDAWWAQNGDYVERTETEGTVTCLGPATDDVINQVLAELQDKVRTKEEEIEKLRQERYNYSVGDACVNMIRFVNSVLGTGEPFLHPLQPLDFQFELPHSPSDSQRRVVEDALAKKGWKLKWSMDVPELADLADHTLDVRMSCDDLHLYVEERLSGYA